VRKDWKIIKGSKERDKRRQDFTIPVCTFSFLDVLLESLLKKMSHPKMMEMLSPF
jgi:hypothetical protein